MAPTLLVLLIGPSILSAVAALVVRRVTWTAWINALTMPLSVGAALTMAAHLAAGGPAVEGGSLWRVDAVSALFATLVSAIATLAAWTGPGFTVRDERARAEARTFRIYINLFAATMLIAVSTNNLGVMWVAIEASTVASALLIPLGKKRAAIDASWTYLLIGSVGIALAFTGTVLAFVDFASAGRSVDAALNWPTLLASAPSLHPEIMRLAFVFLLVGFGTKAGLAPMHTWLPDAHAEAPAPLSAMMSGVMLAVALYAVARWKAVVDVTLGARFADTLLLTVGLVTIAVGALSLLVQRDYKRLLAFSSIEHIGLACFGLALGPAGVFAALLHVTAHAFAKSAAFLFSGRILDRYGTHQIAGVSGLLSTAPPTAVLFGASVLALAGLPPFGLFLSELLLIRAGWVGGHPWLTGAVLVLMLVAFGGLVHHLQRMWFGERAHDVAIGERVTASIAAASMPIAALVWMGIALPAPLTHLLTRAAEILRP